MLADLLIPFVLSISLQFASAQEPSAPTAPPSSGTRLIVLAKSAATAQLFDPVARTLTATIPVGNGPHEVAVSPDGRTAVVSDYGDQKPGSTLTVIDVPSARATATIELTGEETVGGERKMRTFLRPHGIRFLQDGKQVVVTSESTRRLLVVDLATKKVVRTLPTTQSTLHMVELSPDGITAFGTSIQDGTLGVFALDGSNASAKLTATGDGAEGLAVSPRDGSIWVGNRSADSLSVLDGADHTVKATIPTATFPIRVAFTTDGTRVLVSCAEAGCVQVFDAAKRQLEGTIDLLGDKTELSPVPIGICPEPDGKRAWIACQRGEFLALVDLATLTVIDRIPGGKGPDGMAFAAWNEAQPGEAK